MREEENLKPSAIFLYNSYENGANNINIFNSLTMGAL